MRTILDGLTVGKINESLLHTKELIDNTNRSMEALTSLIRPLTNILPNTEYELLDYLQGIVERTSMLCDLEYLTHPGNIYDLMNKTERLRDEAYAEMITARNEYNAYIAGEYTEKLTPLMQYLNSHMEEDEDGDIHYIPPDYDPEKDETYLQMMEDFQQYENKAGNLLAEYSKAQEEYGRLSYLYDIYSNQFEVLKQNETVVYVAPEDFEFIFGGYFEDSPEEWYVGTYTKYDGGLSYYSTSMDSIETFYAKTYLEDDFLRDGEAMARRWDDYTKYNSPAFLFDRHEWTWNNVTYTDYITDDSYVPYWESILLNSTPYITPYDCVCNEGDNPTATKWGSHMYHLHTDGMVSYSLGSGRDWHTRWMIKVCYLDLTTYPNKKDFMPGYGIEDFIDKDYPGKS